MNKQSGVSLGGLLIACVIFGVLALLGMKVAPDVMEYFTIVKTVKTVATDPSLKGASVTDLRKSFDKRASIDNINSIKGEDLDITKDGNEIVITFAYERKIPLVAPVSLAIDFQGSSAK